MSNTTKKKKTNRVSTIHNVVRNGHEAKVIGESLQRAGKNPQLKGVIHEVLIKDSINSNPQNILNGVKAQLTHSTNAKTVDIVVSKGAKVVGRIQAKDTVSSISKTVRQVKSGQYQSAKLLGTKETAVKLSGVLEKAGLSKPVSSSGVSSQTTKALAVKAGVTGSTGMSQACMTAARAGAVSGGAVSAGFAVIKGIADLANDEKDLGEVIVDVGKEAAGGAISAAGASAASTACGVAVASGVAAAGITGAGAVALTVGLPVVAAIGVGIAVKSICDEIFEDISGGSLEDIFDDIIGGIFGW